MKLEDRHAVVSGGGSGIGAATALALAEAGARVTILGRREIALRGTAARHESIGWAICDVTDEKAVRAALDGARKTCGPVDIMVANAGAAHSVPFSKLTPEKLDAMISVNLGGVVHCWQAALPDVTASAQGRLIAIASTAGLKGYPYVSAYCAAKHAVVGLTRALAVELAGSGATVNAVCPGFVETELLERSLATVVDKTGRSLAQARAELTRGNPQGRLVKPDEVASAVLWLCSDAARSVNGHALTLSGGEI